MKLISSPSTLDQPSKQGIIKKYTGWHLATHNEVKNGKEFYIEEFH